MIWVRIQVSASGARKGLIIMTRNSLFFIGGALLAAMIGAGYWFYQDRSRSGVDISIGGHGVSIRER